MHKQQLKKDTFSEINTQTELSLTFIFASYKNNIWKTVFRSDGQIIFTYLT